MALMRELKDFAHRSCGGMSGDAGEATPEGSTVQAMLAARIDRLPPQDKRLLGRPPRLHGSQLQWLYRAITEKDPRWG